MSDFARIVALRILHDLEYSQYRTLPISTLTWTFTGAPCGNRTHDTSLTMAKRPRLDL